MPYDVLLVDDHKIMRDGIDSGNCCSSASRPTAKLVWSCSYFGPSFLLRKKC